MASKRRTAKRILIGAAIAIVALTAVFVWYVNDYNHAGKAALEAVADADGPADDVTIQEISDDAIAFVPDDPQAGFIFYPGAKVQPEAYTPLLTQCAKGGILCVLVKPLFNLAVFDENAAKGIQERFPGIGTWLIGGHSMGGVAASDYLAKHEAEFDGIVFIASYPNSDLSSFDGAALSILGTNDGVLDRKEYEEAKVKLPADAREVVIEGGNHSGFGDYGTQAHDNAATISPAEQQSETAKAIVDFGLAA